PRLSLHPPRPHLGEPQQVIDQLSHAMCRSADAIEMAACLATQHRAGILDQGLAEPGDATQRCKKIVGDRVTERLQFLKSGLRFGSALADPLLQLRVERPLRVLRLSPLGDVAQVTGVELLAVPRDLRHRELHWELTAVAADGSRLDAAPQRFEFAGGVMTRQTIAMCLTQI